MLWLIGPVAAGRSMLVELVQLVEFPPEEVREIGCDVLLQGREAILCELTWLPWLPFSPSLLKGDEEVDGNDVDVLNIDPRRLRLGHGAAVAKLQELAEWAVTIL